MDMKKFRALLEKRTRNMKKSGVAALETKAPEKWGKLNTAIEKMADQWIREFLYGRLPMKKEDPALPDFLKALDKIGKNMEESNTFRLIQYLLYQEGDLEKAAETLAPFRRLIVLAYFPYWEKHVTGKGTKEDPYKTDLLEGAAWDEKAGLWRGKDGAYAALPPKMESAGLKDLGDALIGQATEKLVAESCSDKGAYMTFRDGILGYSSFAIEAVRQFIERDLTETEGAVELAAGVLTKSWDSCSQYVTGRVKDMLMDQIRKSMAARADVLPCHVPDAFVIDLIREYYGEGNRDEELERKAFEAAYTKRLSVSTKPPAKNRKR